ncbi:MAG: hypothetical protein J1F23_08490 [Oscillospiraceae bacterium]|nr:hypothetical protein [Oscillospiraceae bacterium]
MEIINTFLSEYGTGIIYTVIIAIAGYIGRIAKKYINDKTKKSVVRTVVQAVEQIYTDLHGADKLKKAIESATEMLNEKGITVTDLELRMLIESALAEFNKAFYKDTPLSTASADGTTFYENNLNGLTFEADTVPIKELKAGGNFADNDGNTSERADE